MRAAVLSQSSGPDFGDFEDPSPSSGQVLVEVSAAAINPIDLILARGHVAVPGFQPIVPGREGVGFVNGRRVYFSSLGNPFGSMAEKSIATEDRLFDVPEGVSDGDALSMGIAGLTAWLSLSHSARLEKGEHVVILGASGAVGLLAVQAARLLGAGRIVAAARSESGLVRATKAGADAVVLLQDGKDAADELKRASGGRIDVIIDPIWGPFAVAALQAASAGSRMVQIGNSAGQQVVFNPAFMRMGEKRLLGFSSSAVSSSERADLFKRLCTYKLKGEMGIAVDEIPLSDVADAWNKQASFPHRKLVLKV